MTLDTNPSATLAAFAADLSFDTIPAPVLRRTEDLFLDWYASGLIPRNDRLAEEWAALVLSGKELKLARASFAPRSPDNRGD